MKVFTAAILSSIVGSLKASHLDDSQCTHGKLYLLDNTTSLVHVIDVHEGNLENLSVGQTVDVGAGAGELVYYGQPGDPLVVQFRGEEPDFDGFVRVIDTGYSYVDEILYADPSIVQNALIECNRPIHQVRHDDKIAIFCDGSFNAVPQANTTIHVIDETKLGSDTESAIVHSVMLAGTHHGVAIPVDDGHLMHSVPLPERVDRVNGTTSLPTTFQMVDFDGNVIDALDDETNTNTHCSGFHGSASVENTFALGCDAGHGAIVIVDYDPLTETYSSRAVEYPDEPEFEGFRIGSFAYHKKNDHFVGSLTMTNGETFHLGAITPTTTAITADNILTLPGSVRQCSYQYEVGTGEYLLVFMPNGFLHVFKVENGGFTPVIEKEIVPGMSACNEATFTAGIAQAFVTTRENKMLYAIDLTNITSCEIEVFETQLPFFPSGLTVSGFDVEHACRVEPSVSGEELDCFKSAATASGVVTASVFGVLAVLSSIFLF